MPFTKTEISGYYVAVFNRASEGEGNTFWQGSDGSAADVVNTMLATSAAQEYFGSSLDTNQAFIEHIYLNTLGKTVVEDPVGIAFWVEKLDAGESRGAVVVDLVFAASQPENAGDAQDQFNNRVEVSDYTADTLELPPADLTDLAFDSGLTVTSDSSTVATAEAAVDELTLGGTGSTFTLTNDTDMATANVFNAPMVFTPDGSDRILSLQDEDVLTGEAGANNNTLNVTMGQANADEGERTVRTPELKNIQVLNLDVTGTTNVFDARFSDSLDTINVAKITSAAGGVLINNIITTASNLSASNVLDNASTIGFDYVRGLLAGGSDALTLTLDNILAQSLTVTAGGGQAVGVVAASTLNEGFETVNLAVTNGVDFRTALNVEDMENLVITGSGNLDVLNQVFTTSEYNLFTAALGNGGSIGQRTIDASAFTGDLNIDVSLGMGANVDPTASGALYHTVITGGVGDDTFHTNVGMASSVNGTQDGIDGGEGINTLVSYVGAITGGVAGSSNPANNTNIQNLELRDQGVMAAVDFDAFDSELTSIYMRDEDVGATTFTLNDLTVELAASGMTLAHNIAAAGAQTVVANLKVATGATDTMALTVADSESLTPGNFNYTFTAGGTDTDGIAGTVNTGVAATSDADAIENIVLHDNDTEGNTVTLTNAINHTNSVVLDGGTAGLAYTVANTLNAATVDASAQLSNLRLTVGDTVGAITTITQDVMLGLGNDVLTYANVDELDATDSLTDAGGTDTVRAAFSQNSTLDIAGIENLHVTSTANVTLNMANADVTNLVMLANSAIGGGADIDNNGVADINIAGGSLAANVITLDNSTLTQLNFFGDADTDDDFNPNGGLPNDDVTAHTFNGITLSNNTSTALTANINTSLDENQSAASGGGAATYTLGQLTTHGNTSLDIQVGNERDGVNAALTTTTIANIFAKTMSSLTATAVGNLTLGTVSGAPLNNSLTTFDMSGVGGVVNASIISLGDGAVVTLGSANHVVTALGSAGKNVVMTAGNGNNTLTGTAQSDTITTGSGWDIIAADRGDNVISSGAGNDAVTAKDGNDTVSFGGGINTLQDNFATAIDSTLATNTVALTSGVATVQIDTTGDGFGGGDVNQILAVGSGSDLTVSWLGGTLNAATAVLDGALASVDVMVSTAGADLVIATAIGGDTFTGGAGNDVYITAVGTASFLDFTGGTGNDAAVGSDGTDLFNGGLGADFFVMQNSTVLDLDADVVTIVDGDSTAAAWDVIVGFDTTGVARATPGAAATAGTNVGDDKLDLDDATIAGAAANVNGTNAGVIQSHTIDGNGAITFDIDDTNAFAAVTVGANVAGGQISLTDAIAYLAANITTTGTVMFNYDANGDTALNAADSTFVFQNGTNDTLVELVGTYTGLEAAGAAGSLIEIA